MAVIARYEAICCKRYSGQLEIAPKNRYIYGNININMKSIHPDDFRVDSPINLAAIPTRLRIDADSDQKEAKLD